MSHRYDCECGCQVLERDKILLEMIQNITDRLLDVEKKLHLGLWEIEDKTFD